MSDNQQLISIDSLRVQSTPAVLIGNFHELNKWIDEKLSTQITVITDESVKAEKKVVAELRKLAKEIDGKTKEVTAMVSGDIDLFASNMKALKAKVLAVADDKAEQVRALEEKTRTQCRDALLKELYSGWEKGKLASEFQKATIDDLVKLTSLTATGVLTKAAMAEVENRVRRDIALKNRTVSRIMAMENQCLRADINPPLTRVNIEPFLFVEDDLLFQQNLDKLVNAEIDRKVMAEQRLRAKLEAEKQREIDAALQAQQDEANRIAKEAANVSPINTVENKVAIQAVNGVLDDGNNKVAPLAQPKTTAPDNAVTYTITALVSFEIQSRPNADVGKMRAYFTEQLQNDGKKVISMNVKAVGNEVAA